jgi:hypothetical protein
MERKMIPLEYANSLIFELEKAFYDERGKGARFRLTTLGRKFYQQKIEPAFEKADIANILETVQKVLVEEGIITKISYQQEDRLIRVQIEGCIHCPVEEHMRNYGVEPMACFPVNLAALAIEEKLDQPVEIAEIRVENGVCNLMLIIFEKRPVLE